MQNVTVPACPQLHLPYIHRPRYREVEEDAVQAFTLQVDWPPGGSSNSSSSFQPEKINGNTMVKHGENIFIYIYISYIIYIL